jgi:glycosyltransferase involved in cell wall biosynthesis
MQRAGLDVTVACPHIRENAKRDTAFVDRLTAAGVPVVEISMRYGIHLLADLRSYRCLVHLLRRGHYDVIHTHSSKAGVLGRIAGWRYGVPALVYTPNAFAFLGARNRLLRWLYRTVEQRLGHQATDALICVSRSEMELADELAIVPSERLVLIENTIDAAHLAPFAAHVGAKSALGLDPDRLAVGYSGRLARQKGVEYLIQAMRQVVASGENAQLLLVGEGELDQPVRQMVADHHLEDHVVLAGYRVDIPEVLAALDVFVLPSLYEGLPYALMEAMAVGRAVIATDVGGNRDLLRDGVTGLLVPPCDPRALAGALLQLLRAPRDRERLGRAALAAASARPTPEQRARQVAELYKKVLERKRNEP